MSACHIGHVWFFILHSFAVMNKSSLRYVTNFVAAVARCSVKYLHMCVCVCQSVFWGTSLHAEGADFSPFLVFIHCNNLQCHSVPYTMAQMIILGSSGSGHYCSSFLAEVSYACPYPSIGCYLSHTLHVLPLILSH